MNSDESGLLLDALPNSVLLDVCLLAGLIDIQA